MGEFTVSVIIPCYNHGRYLKEALDSVEASTYPHIEVIVVDDGSSDQETLQYIDSCRNITIKNRSVVFLRQPNCGPAAARNKGIRHSTGQFILPLDADDKIDPTYIEKCVWILTKHADISIVYPSVRLFGLKTEIRPSQPYDFYHLLHHNFIIVTSMFRRNVWEEIQGFDESLSGYEDWDFWIRAGAAGHRGYWLREPLFLYRKAETSKLVLDNKSRSNLIRIIREKNHGVYRSVKRNRHGQQKSQADLLQKFYVQIIHLSSLVPEWLKDVGRKRIKPLFEKFLNRCGATNTFQVQSLEVNAVDVYITEEYVRRRNPQYIELFDDSYSDSTAEGEELSILFIVPWLVVGGADKVNLDLAQQFASKGHDVHIFTTNKVQHTWEDRFKAISPHITHLSNLFMKMDELLDYAIDYIEAKKIKIVQISNSQLGYQMAGVIKKHCPHVKIVDLLHMEEPYYPFDYFRYSVRFKEFLNHRIVITSYLKEVSVTKYGEQNKRVTVIPNGISVLERYEDTTYVYKNQKKPITIGFVGRIEEQKQPFDFIRIAREIQKKDKTIRFIMIGNGSLLKRTKRLANSLGISSVLFLGERDNAAQIMKDEFHILLAPSLREGLPIVGLEALSLGIPIVATRVPGWTDIVQPGKTGYLSEVGDYKAMARCCLELLNGKVREIMSEQCFIRAKKEYNIERTAEKYLEVYRGELS